MKKNLLSVFILTTSLLLASCSEPDSGQGAGPASDGAGSAYHSSGEPGGEAGAGMGAGNLPGDGESGGGKPGDGEFGGGKSGEGESEGGKPGDGLAGGGNSASGKEGGEAGESWEEEDIFLSDQILHAGDTLQVMYYQDENTLCQEMEFTLHKAGLYDSPEAAGLGNAELVEETEVYDRDGNPGICSIAGMKILACDLTAYNIDAVEGSNQHISAIMLACADSSTQKVTMISCMPIYFSASSSQPGSTEYYHYDLPKGESRDMTVAWAVPDGYEAENLYLCVTYDNRDSQERQYFKLID